MLAPFSPSLSWFLSCSVKGLFGQVVPALEGGEGHTQVVRRLDQLADHADGFFARVEMDVRFPFFCLRLPCSNRVVDGITGSPDPEYFSMKCSALRSQFPFGCSVSYLLKFQVHFRTWTDEDPISWPKTSFVISDDFGLLEFGSSPRWVCQ